MSSVEHPPPVRVRVPATEVLPVAFAIPIGTVVGLVRPILWPAAPGGGLALGLLAALGGWVILGQVPGRLEAAVSRKADVVLGIGIAVPATAAVLASATGQFGLTRGTVVRALVALGAGIVSLIAGTAHRAQHHARSEQAHATTEATLVTRYRGLPLVVGMVPVYFVITAALGTPSIGGAVGSVIGLSISVQFVGGQSRDLTVVDSGIVLDEEQSLGATYVPWRRLLVSVREDTVRLRRRYVIHSEYHISCDGPTAAREFARTVEQIRRRRPSA